MNDGKGKTPGAPSGADDYGDEVLYAGWADNPLSDPTVSDPTAAAPPLAPPGAKPAAELSPEEAEEFLKRQYSAQE